MRRRIVHLLVCLLPVAAALGLMATGASALVVHLPGGRTAGLQLRPGVNPAAVSGSRLGSDGHALAGPALADNGTLNYDGGPVLHATRPYLVFWDPTGTGIAATSRSVLEQYLTDVAADSGESDDTYGVARQYYDVSGFAGASASFTAAAQAISDTQPYPTLDTTNCSVPSGYTNCVTDTQVQAELTRLIAAGGLPTGIGSPAPVYFVVTPLTTDLCVDARACADAGSSGSFCAYHSNFSDAHRNQVVYAVLPFAALKANPKDCQGDNPANTAVQEPNGDVADVVADNLSHENLEAITDPLPQTPAWIDNSTQNEVADNCEAYGPVANETNNNGGPVNPNAYSPTLGGSATPVAPATYGTLYDQSINGHGYYTQTVWSNGDINCEAKPSAAGLTPGFTAPTSVVSAGMSVTFDPTASTSTAGVSSTTWSFGDGASSFSPGGPGSTSHAFVAPGSYTVALTLVDSRGNLATTTHSVTVAASAAPPVTVTPPKTAPVAPTASFSISPVPGVTGSPMSLDGSGSSDPNSGASVSAYAWSFDDGASATGASVTHTFAAPGQHSITLTITDSLGLSSQTTHTILVVARGRITGIAVRKVRGTEYLVVTVSQAGLVRFASKAASLTAPGSTRFKLTLTKAQRRRLANHHNVRDPLTIVYTPLYGPQVQKTQSVTIRP